MTLSDLVPFLLIFWSFVFGFFGITGKTIKIESRAKMLVFSCALLMICVGMIYKNISEDTLKRVGLAVVDKKNFPIAQTYSPAPPVSSLRREKFTQLTRADLKGTSTGSILLWKDLILYGTEESSLEAISRENGNPAWSLKVSNPIDMLSEGKDGGCILAGGRENSSGITDLYCIEASSGKVVWQTTFVGGFKKAPAVNPKLDLISFPMTNGNIWTLFYSTGEKYWKYRSGPIVVGNKFVGDQLIIETLKEDKKGKTLIESVVASNGRNYWFTFIDGEPLDLMTATENKKTLILALTEISASQSSKTLTKGLVHAVIGNGRKLWSATLPSLPVPTAVHIRQNSTVVYSTKDGLLLSLWMYNGREVWRKKIAKEMRAGLSLFFPLTNPIIASVSYDGIFSLREATNGNELVHYSVEPGAKTQPVMSEDMAYVLTPHKLYIFGGLMSLAE